MIYRIHFEPKGAYWCVQFQKWYLFWQSVTGADGKVITFDNVDAAAECIRKFGINRVYQSYGISIRTDENNAEKTLREIQQLIIADKRNEMGEQPLLSLAQSK